MGLDLSGCLQDHQFPNATNAAHVTHAADAPPMPPDAPMPGRPTQGPSTSSREQSANQGMVTKNEARGYSTHGGRGTHYPDEGGNMPPGSVEKRIKRDVVNFRKWEISARPAAPPAGLSAATPRRRAEVEPLR